MYIYIYTFFFNTSYFHKLVQHLTGEGSARSATLATTSISTDCGWGAHTCMYIYIYYMYTAFFCITNSCVTFLAVFMFITTPSLDWLERQQQNQNWRGRRERRPVLYIYIFFFWDWFKFLTWQVKATQSLQAHPLPPPPQHEAPMHTYRKKASSHFLSDR